MSINVTVVTVANSVQRFIQNEETHIQALLESLGSSDRIFKTSSLIIVSDIETTLFSPPSLTRIEIQTERDISAFIPDGGVTLITSIAACAEARATRVEDEYFASRIDFHFMGGDVLPAWVEGPRSEKAHDRLAHLTQIFQRPYLLYKLPEGGFGLMNPAAMTRIHIHADVDLLPAGTWRLNTCA